MHGGSTNNRNGRNEIMKPWQRQDTHRTRNKQLQHIIELFSIQPSKYMIITMQINIYILNQKRENPYLFTPRFEF